MASKIKSDYQSKDIVYLVVLKGAFIFASDIIREIGIESEVFFINASSYKSGLISSGNVELQIGPINVERRDILIIEDIVDSGRTMSALIKDLEKYKPNSVEIATFFSKPEERVADIRVKYIGIEIPSKFVIGYGLDYAEQGRYLKDIYVLTNHSI